MIIYCRVYYDGRFVIICLGFYFECSLLELEFYMGLLVKMEVICNEVLYYLEYFESLKIVFF